MAFKAVITTDLHLRTTDKYGKILPSGLNSRLQDRLDHLTQSVNQAIEEKADYWICLGDVFDKINPAEILRKKFIEILAPLMKHKIPIIILIGNHDTDSKIYSFMTESDLLNTLSSDAMTILYEPCEMTLKGVECLMIPYTSDDIIEEWLTKTKDKIVFGHFGVSGAVVSGTEFILSKGLSPKLFNHHRYTYLGHYHKPQSTKKWMYVGSIAKASYAERSDKKGYLVLKAGEKKIAHTFIDVEDRIFFQYTIEEEGDPQFGALLNWEDLEGQVVKLLFVGEEDWYLKFNIGEIRSRILKSLKASKLFIEHKTRSQARVRVPEIDASSDWREGIEIYTKKTKRPDMLDIGLKILQEVL